MSSETITRNDLTNILNDILPVYNSTGFTVEKITASSATSVSANGGTAWIQVRIPSGYEPVCIVGYYLNGGSGCSVYNEAIAKDSNGYYCSFALRNAQTTVNTVTIDAYVLCKQSLTHFTQAMADYIVEQGTDGIWTYTKWNNGSYDAVYVGNVNMQTGSAMGGGYFHQTTSVLTPPSFSQTVKSLHGSANSAVLFSYVGHANDYSTYWWNASSTAVNNVSVRLEMHGTWK